MCLIQKCVCGNRKLFSEVKKHDIDILRCKICRVQHQKVLMTEEQYEQFYSVDYHDKHQTEIGCVPYAERYQHDMAVAYKRISTYGDLLLGVAGKKLLDVGSGNGAFVDACRLKEMDAFGFDLGSLGNEKHTYKGKSLLEIALKKNTFDVVTMHDVFEHLVDPIAYLDRIHLLLKKDGYLIIDFPNYFIKAGEHHWRKTQHLWFFTIEELMDLLDIHGYNVTGVHTPIAGKLVFYCQKKIVED